MRFEFKSTVLEKNYLIDPVKDIKITYRDLLSRASNLANCFGNWAEETPKKIALVVLKKPENYTAVLMACWISGLIPAVYSPNLTEELYESVLKEFDFDFIVSDFELKSTSLKGRSLSFNDKINASFADCEFYSLSFNEEDVALLLFSSGTSGKQKCIPLSFANLKSNIRSFNNRLDIGAKNVFLCGSPLWHAHGLYNSFLTTLFLNATVIYSGPLSMLNVTGLLRSITETNGIVFHITPSMIPILLMYAKKNKGNVMPVFYRTICGTSFLDTKSKKELENSYHTKIFQQYGMTETLFMTVNDLFSNEKPDSVGQIIDGVILEICDGDTIQPIGKPGLIRVRTNACYGSYFSMDADQSSFKEDFFYTGDIGYFDQDLCLFITGREKDLIKKGGFSISANTITTAIMQIEGIEEAYTIGVKDTALGEEIYSFYVAEKEIDENLIRTLLKKSIPGNLMPRKIYKVDALTKTSTGKVSRPGMEEILNKII